MPEARTSDPSGAARTRTIVHRVEPAVRAPSSLELAANRRWDCPRTLCRFQSWYRRSWPELFGFSVSFCSSSSIQRVIHSRLIIARHFVIHAPQWLGCCLDLDFSLHGLRGLHLQHPEPGGFLPFAVIPLRLKPDAVRDRTSAALSGRDRVRLTYRSPSWCRGRPRIPRSMAAARRAANSVDRIWPRDSTARPSHGGRSRLDSGSAAAHVIVVGGRPYQPFRRSDATPPKGLFDLRIRRPACVTLGRQWP